MSSRDAAPFYPNRHPTSTMSPEERARRKAAYYALIEERNQLNRRIEEAKHAVFEVSTWPAWKRDQKITL